MGFILGFLMGLLTGIALGVFVVWLLLGRLNKEATARVLQTAALVLQNKVEIKQPEQKKEAKGKEPMGFKRGAKE